MFESFFWPFWPFLDFVKFVSNQNAGNLVTEVRLLIMKVINF